MTCHPLHTALVALAALAIRARFRHARYFEDLE